MAIFYGGLLFLYFLTHQVCFELLSQNHIYLHHGDNDEWECESPRKGKKGSLHAPQPQFQHCASRNRAYTADIFTQSQLDIQGRCCPQTLFENMLAGICFWTSAPLHSWYVVLYSPGENASGKQFCHPRVSCGVVYTVLMMDKGAKNCFPVHRSTLKAESKNVHPVLSLHNSQAYGKLCHWWALYEVKMCQAYCSEILICSAIPEAKQCVHFEHTFWRALH